MKLEWGKKIHCPACALPFYDMQKKSVLCPNCGHKFESSLTLSKHKQNTVMDEVIDDEDDKVAISSFDFIEETDDDISGESEDIAVKSEIEDIKLVDEQ
ncbi:MAG: FYDLN acid domain-containing protein [Alphaproteobacteria bacterium]|nr:FYDLN acid domain-containing protein [Alphaproteobacteria bacterium]